MNSVSTGRATVAEMLPEVVPGSEAARSACPFSRACEPPQPRSRPAVRARRRAVASCGR